MPTPWRSVPRPLCLRPRRGNRPAPARPPPLNLPSRPAAPTPAAPPLPRPPPGHADLGGPAAREAASDRGGPGRGAGADQSGLPPGKDLSRDSPESSAGSPRSPTISRMISRRCCSRRTSGARPPRNFSTASRGARSRRGGRPRRSLVRHQSHRARHARGTRRGQPGHHLPGRGPAVRTPDDRGERRGQDHHAGQARVAPRGRGSQGAARRGRHLPRRRPGAAGRVGASRRL